MVDVSLLGRWLWWVRQFYRHRAAVFPSLRRYLWSYLRYWRLV